MDDYISFTMAKRRSNRVISSWSGIGIEDTSMPTRYAAFLDRHWS